MVTRDSIEQFTNQLCSDLPLFSRERVAELLFLLACHIEAHFSPNVVRERKKRHDLVAKPMLQMLKDLRVGVEFMRSHLQELRPFPGETQKVHRDRIRRLERFLESDKGTIGNLRDELMDHISLFIFPMGSNVVPLVSVQFIKTRAGAKRPQGRSRYNYFELNQGLQKHPIRIVNEIVAIYEATNLSNKRKQAYLAISEFVRTHIPPGHRTEFLSIKHSALREQVRKFRRSREYKEPGYRLNQRVIKALLRESEWFVGK